MVYRDTSGLNQHSLQQAFPALPGQGSLAIEYATRGVRANAVSPGITATPMHPPETRAGLGRYHPLGRMGTVADVVQAVMYIEEASFVTGETS